MRFRPLILCLLIGGVQAVKAGDLLCELSAKQKESVAKGWQVLLTEDVTGKPWPRVKVYQTVNATPEEVAAVFFDYESAKSFVPNVLKSEISKRINPCTLEVDYCVDVPILPNEFYTVRNSLRTVDGGGFRVEWTLVKALQTKSSEGHLRIEPFDGKSLICYTNLIEPNSGMAGILRSHAIEQIRLTVSAIVNQVETEKSKEAEKLSRQVEALHAAIKQ